MPPMLSSILVYCSDLLARRLSLAVFTTEDSVRYTFFAALLQEGYIPPEDVILELRHPGLQRAEIDAWIRNLDGEPAALEFKYDRQIPSGRNAPRTMKAGKVFHDLSRLSSAYDWLKCRLVFVYLADREMSSYFRNPANRFTDFFNQEVPSPILLSEEYLTQRSTTFRGAVGSIGPTIVDLIFSSDLPNDHALRVYEVRPAPELAARPWSG